MKSSLYTFIRGIIKGVVHFFGWDVVRYNLKTSEELLLKTIIDQYRIKTILDVGANEGQYAERIMEHGFTGTIYSFEPIPSVFAKLERKVRLKSAQWHAFNLGMGSEDADLMINVTENFMSSSLFKVGENSLTAEPKTKITHQEKVKITTIDSFLSSQKTLGNGIMLKLDIQGFELEALRGALESLRNFDVIQVELSFAPVYEGAPLYKEIISFLESQHFELYTFIPVFINNATGRMLQADGVFVRSRPDN